MTTDERTLIDAALTKADGNKKNAAAILGFSYSKLNCMIAGDTTLKAKWISVRKIEELPSAEVMEISRPEAVVSPAEDGDDAVTMTEMEISNALDREDEAVKNGLRKIGQSEIMADMGKELHAYQRKFHAATLNVLGGGVVKQYLDLTKETADVVKALAEQEDPFERNSLRLYRVQLETLKFKAYSLAVQASMSSAIIKHRLEKKKDKEDKPPGYLRIQSKHTNVLVQNGPDQR